MNKLHTLLTQLSEALQKLQPILQEENKQLSALKVNPVSLQIISDHKSRLLATIAHYDEQRRRLEQELSLATPYDGHEVLSQCWQQIVQQVKASDDLNRQNGELLQKQMNNAAGFRSAVDKAGAGLSLYGQKGKTMQPGAGRAYNITA